MNIQILRNFNKYNIKQNFDDICFKLNIEDNTGIYNVDVPTNNNDDIIIDKKIIDKNNKKCEINGKIITKSSAKNKNTVNIDDEWRHSLKVNDKIDAKDEGKWYNSEIIELNTDINKIKIHYMGFDTKYDEYIDINSNRLSPFNSNSANMNMNELTLKYKTAGEQNESHLLFDNTSNTFCHIISDIMRDESIDSDIWIPRRVIFVIDRSGSMGGSKWLKTISSTIMAIKQLKKDFDRFGIILFDQNIELLPYKDLNGLMLADNKSVSDSIKALQNEVVGGSTNINDALLTAIDLIKEDILLLNNDTNYKYNFFMNQIIFITDGAPNRGQKNTKQIVTNIKNANDKISIFSFGVGSNGNDSEWINDLNHSFLKILSLNNNGFYRRIKKQKADTSLSQYFKILSKPILSNINVEYKNKNITDLTNTTFNTLYHGNDVIICGKIKNETDLNDYNLSLSISAITGKQTKENDKLIIKPINISKPMTMNIHPNNDNNTNNTNNIQRMWAYLKLQQFAAQKLIHNDMIEIDDDEKKEDASKPLSLALKYKFVTPWTSMIVVKKKDGENTEETVKKHYIPAPRSKKNVSSNYYYNGYSSGYYSNSYSFYQNENGAPDQKGVVGLRNLGNTCFMNSTIQCLAQSPQLTDYFLNNKYLRDINKNNPLGSNGSVAKSWGNLLCDIFSGKYRTIAPGKFKSIIGEIAPRFNGYAQHDSQELLSFLLDGLHEDLNQIKNKSSTETVETIETLETKDKSESIAAMKAWNSYLAKNKSMIVDLFQGQYKSKIVCPDCGKISITYDPYTFLSVPLPTDEQYKIIEYTFIDSDTSKPPKIYQLQIKKDADINRLKQIAAKQHNVLKDELFVCDVWKSNIHRELRGHDSINDINIKSDDIFIYHSKKPDINQWTERNTKPIIIKNGKNGKIRKKSDFQTFILINQHRVALHKQYLYGGQQKFEDELLGYPLLITLPMTITITMNQIRHKLWDLIEPLLVNQNLTINDELSFEFWAKWGYLNRRNLKFLIDWKQCEEYKSSLYDKKQRIRDDSASNSLGNTITSNHINDVELLILRENDGWYCSECKDFKCASKKIDLQSCPDLLIIHLKRFNYTKNWRKRINKVVKFAINGLDLSSFLLNKNNAIYDLYAVSNHFGSMNGGHYTANVKNLDNKEWYHLDDSRTEKVSNMNNLISSAAYILYYHKRN